MNLADWPFTNALSILIGLILGLFALWKLLSSAIIKFYESFNTISNNEKLINNHIQDTEKRFTDLDNKIDHASEKIDKIYTILINKL